MNTVTSHVRENSRAHPMVLVYLATAGIVLLLMMAFGLLMKAAQSGSVTLPTDVFYQLLTAHGAGMVGIAGIASSAIMWYFLRRHVPLSNAIFILNLAFFLSGAVILLSGIFIGGFAGAWTFLYPLPAMSMGAWSREAATAFLGGLLLIGVGFLLLYLDIGRAIIRQYGGLHRGLGWPQLFLGSSAEMPPASVVASTMVLVVNVLGLVSGAAVLVMTIINLYQPAFTIDPLLAKNMIYFFGHVFINATIYMAVIAVYEVLPVYTDRPWKPTRVFLAAWTASMVMVVIVYPHHLLMDFVMPQWMHILGQAISYTSGFPVLLVTTYGALTIVYRSGIRWDVISGLLLLSVFGWAAGVIPAIVDATVVINQVMHNTLWVPGHFHFYLLVGLMSMVFGFMYYIAANGERNADSNLDRAGLLFYASGAVGLVAMFLYSGLHSVPRRFDAHLQQWAMADQLAFVFAAMAVLGVLVFLTRFFLAIPRVLRTS